MGTKSREVIFGSRHRHWKAAIESTRREGSLGGEEGAPRSGRGMVRSDGRVRRAVHPSPTIVQCISGGLGWLEVECMRRHTRVSMPLRHTRRPLDTPVWKLEASLRCRSYATGRILTPTGGKTQGQVSGITHAEGISNRSRAPPRQSGSRFEQPSSSTGLFP
ncbi:hypothetical protein Rpal_2695 [Rhodopseudomonas palustris TIE-1]|nr:hypothetical protein Rpal_2695 [Rhodopseudomonas palustris TIE-1]